MNQKVIKSIFLKYKFGQVKSIKKIEIGFTNKVYLIDDKYILKVCEDLENEDNFEKEVFFYNFFNEKIPVPKIRFFDNSKMIYDKYFMIYNKIEGDNLYSQWHLMNDSERKDIIKQLCVILRTINKSSYKNFTHQFKLHSSFNWHDKVLYNIKKSLKKIKQKKLLSRKTIEKINSFVKKNHAVLSEQKMALVHGDVHFDNILVKKNKIFGILDFEKMDLYSLDFTLDVIKRMVDYPKKYISKDFEKYVKKEDYSQLLICFKEFYPELFDFKNLDKRLDLYALEYELATLLNWPNSKEVKRMIAQTISYKNSAL